MDGPRPATMSVTSTATKLIIISSLRALVPKLILLFLRFLAPRLFAKCGAGQLACLKLRGCMVFFNSVTLKVSG